MMYLCSPLQTKLKKADADFQHMVNTRMKKLDEVIASMESRKVRSVFYCFSNMYVMETIISFLFVLKSKRVKDASTLPG